MKKTILLSVISAFSCKAQIIPQNNAYVDIPYHAYIKDTENFLDNFVGTWQYQNGNEQFILTLSKVSHFDYGRFYEDILIGEYKYVNSNGVTIVNTLADINNPNIIPLEHNISGANSLVRLENHKCLDCNIGEYRIKSNFYDPDRTYQELALIFRSISPTQIKVRLLRDGVSTSTDPNAPDDLRIPEGNYVMNKI